MTSPGRYFGNLLKILPEEMGPFIALASTWFLEACIASLLTIYIDTYFIKRYGVRYLPAMIALGGLISLLLLPLLLKLLGRLRDIYLLPAALALFGGLLVPFFLLVEMGNSIAYPVLYQANMTFGTLLVVFLWNLAGDTFDARQGKRIFPLLVAAEVLGIILGSLMAKPFLHLAGRNTVLLVMAVSLAGLSFYSFLACRRFARPRVRNHVAGLRRRKSPGLIDFAFRAFRYPTVWYLMVGGLAAFTIFPIFSYQLSVIADRAFVAEESMASFLGLVRGLTSIFTLFTLFLSGRFISRIGLPRAALITPIGFTVVLAVMWVQFDAYAAAFAFLIITTLYRTIHRPVEKCFLSLVPSDALPSVRNIIQGGAPSLATMVSGLSMLGLSAVLEPKNMSMATVGLSVFFLLASLWFMKRYRLVLKQAAVADHVDIDRLWFLSQPEVGYEVSGEMAERTNNIGLQNTESFLGDPSVNNFEPLLNAISSRKMRTEFTADHQAVSTSSLVTGDSENELSDWPPALEFRLIRGQVPEQAAILEIMRLSGLTEFDLHSFVGNRLIAAFNNLVAIDRLGLEQEALSVTMLVKTLNEFNQELIRIVFLALAVKYTDMGLMNLVLKSGDSAISVEYVEETVEKETARYVTPFIDRTSLKDKIRAGRKLFPLIKGDSLARVLGFCVNSEDAAVRAMTLFAVGDFASRSLFIPIAESLVKDTDKNVRTLARFAVNRCKGVAAQMPEIVGTVNLLKSSPLFEGLGIRELYAIASVSNRDHLDTDDVIVTEESENSSIFLILSGEVKVFKGYGSNARIELRTMGPGDFFGELSMFTGQGASATVIAAGPTEVLWLQRQPFEEIMMVHPKIAINFCRLFSSKIIKGHY